MANIIRIDISDINDGHVMELTGEVTVGENTALTVPEGYVARILSDGRTVSEVRTCQRKRLRKIIGKEAVGRKIRVLFCNISPLTDMSWGIGNLPVVYTPDERSIEVKVGASGTFLAEIRDPVAFYACFHRDEGAVNLTEVSSCITSAFRVYASKVLVQLFLEAVEPIIDTDFVLDETDRRLEESICHIKHDGIPGIIFKKVRVSNICVREEDVSALREFYKGGKRASGGRRR